MALSVTVHGITVKTGVQTSGRQATANITTKNGLEQVIYTAPSSPGFDYAILAINITNREDSSTDGVYIAVADSDVSKPRDFIEWNTTLVPNGVLERTQIVVQSGQRVILRWGDAPAEIIPDHEILDYAGNWTGAVTGTGTIDSTTADQVEFTLAEGDTGTLTTNAIPTQLIDSETYRVAVSFESTEVTGLDSAIVLNALDSTEATTEALITLGLEDRNKIDEYHTYTFEFTVDQTNGPFKTTVSELELDLADVNATVDRISLIKIS